MQELFVDLGLPSGKRWASIDVEGTFAFEDAVRFFGGRLPGKEDWQELIEHCSVQEDRESECVVLTGPNGGSISFPVASLESTGRSYWSSTMEDGFAVAGVRLEALSFMVEAGVDPGIERNVRLIEK